jgi:hypothetical protein
MPQLPYPQTGTSLSAPQLETGDRFELAITAEPERFRLPPFLADIEAIDVVVGPDGRPWAAEYDPTTRLLHLPAIAEQLGDGCPAFGWNTRPRANSGCELNPPHSPNRFSWAA